MGLKELRAEIDDEVSEILGADFDIEVTKTRFVPDASDSAITFPDLDSKSQGAKLIDTCVLYIDIRRSTELNFSHRPQTVAKLYTAFVRAMTHVARHYGGHVRGIIGDRVMVIFDSEDCFTSAVDCAIAMNTVAKYLINARFKANDVTCGIGIDAGNMLATKTGIRRHGFEQANYRALVWLGHPANIASKLTDLANKAAVTEEVKVVSVAYERQTQPYVFPGSGLSSALGGVFGTQNSDNPLARALMGTTTSNSQWEWKDESPEDFLARLSKESWPSYKLVHENPAFRSFFLTGETRVVRAKTLPILMTAKVWKGFRSANPNRDTVKNGLFKRVAVKTPGYAGAVFGGDVIFYGLRDEA
jgi:class 3 adenylate cyclase